jgi:hypothetical protein
LLTNSEIALYAARALFRKVTPNMRSVSCELRNGKIIIQIVFEVQPSDDELELFWLFETEFISGLHEDVDFDHEILVLESGSFIKALEVLIFGRFEGMEFA